MKWQGIVEFVSVAESQSFSNTAKRLSISTAQVSRQISTLEERLKVKLFYRTTRRVSLTEEGQLFYEHCRHLLDGIDAAEQAVTHHQSNPRGKISLTAPVTYGEKKILPLINEFVARYDGIEITADLSNHQVDMIEGGFDLAIRIGPQPDSSLVAKKISQRANYICASQKYLELHGLPKTPSDLKSHNCLLGTHDHWRLSEHGKSRNVKVKGNLRYNSGLSLLDAAKKGLGIVQLSDYFLLDHIQSGELVSLLEPYSPPKEDIWAVYPQSRYLPSKIRLLIEFLAKELT
ncbi:LysR family transcriptional regulator [Vibrio maritimus]|uniref:LysR family transcriptional regulator n=1 Tax=Vibrio maritimus TaxID=990268 RepID=UPI003734F667